MGARINEKKLFGNGLFAKKKGKTNRTLSRQTPQGGPTNTLQVFSTFSCSSLTWMTLMLRPVSRDSCSLMCLVGFGVAANAAFRVSSCLAFMVVRGPRRFPTALCSSFSLLHPSLSDKCPVSESFPSSCGSWESGDRLGSLHVVTVTRIRHINT